eukprot:jgi/Tetstr1/438446/TSEL_027003.t1
MGCSDPPRDCELQGLPSRCRHFVKRCVVLHLAAGDGSAPSRSNISFNQRRRLVSCSRTCGARRAATRQGITPLVCTARTE